MEVIAKFSKISGYKMNIGKTELMVVNPCKTDSDSLKQFQKQKKISSIWVVTLVPTKKLLFKDNFLPLVKEFKEEVKQWQDLKINLIGRIHLFKMMWLPKFLFKFQTIPITPPKSFFKDLNSTLSSFIWSNKASRLKRKLLHYPKEEGGLNLPNLEVYHLAAQMFYVDRIINNTNEDPWIEIENNQLQKNSLLVALFFSIR